MALRLAMQGGGGGDEALGCLDRSLGQQNQALARDTGHRTQHHHPLPHPAQRRDQTGIATTPAVERIVADPPQAAIQRLHPHHHAMVTMGPHQEIGTAMSHRPGQTLHLPALPAQPAQNLLHAPIRERSDRRARQNCRLDRQRWRRWRWRRWYRR